MKMYEESMKSVQREFPCTNDGVYQYHRRAWDECLNVFKSDTEGISVVNTDKYLKELTVRNGFVRVQL